MHCAALSCSQASQPGGLGGLPGSEHGPVRLSLRPVSLSLSLSAATVTHWRQCQPESDIWNLAIPDIGFYPISGQPMLLYRVMCPYIRFFF